MALLTEKDRQLIRERLQEMEHPVRLVHFTQELQCASCGPARQLLEEVSALSEKLTLEVHNFLLDKEQAKIYGVDKAPATVIVGERDFGARIYGVPAGYEFAVLLEDILEASQRRPTLSAETLERLSGLTLPVHLEVFVTPT